MKALKPLLLIPLLPVLLFVLIADVLRHMAANYADDGEMRYTKRLLDAVLS